MIIPPQLAFYAAQAWVKVLALVAIVIALLFTGYHFGVKLTKADWDQERAAQAVQLAAAEKSARAEENRRAQEAQAVVDGLAEREALARNRAVAAERTVASLRDTVARLNARPAPSNPEAAGYAGEARIARELLGACANEYQGLAAEADGLRDQVTGLQQWVSHVTQ